MSQGGHEALTEAEAPLPVLKKLFQRAIIALLIWVSVLGVSTRFYRRWLMPGTPKFGPMLLSSTLIVTTSGLLASCLQSFPGLVPTASNFLPTFQYFFFLGIFVAIIITALAYQSYRTQI